MSCICIEYFTINSYNKHYLVNNSKKKKQLNLYDKVDNWQENKKVKQKVTQTAEIKWK